MNHLSYLKKLFGSLYYNWYYKLRIKRLRKQETISVVFKIENLGAWKTEELYKLMLSHPRFAPKLYITKNMVEDDRKNLRVYLDRKGYDYVEIDGINKTVWDYSYPDIVLFQKPYRDTFDGFKHLIRYHKTLFLYVSYALHGSIEPWTFQWPYLQKCWQIYYENTELAEEYGKLLQSRIRNSYATGHPIMDELLKDKTLISDQWKNHDKTKKRIIYAPHHSIDPENEWRTSTFIENGEIILELAKKYSDKVQWTFKPHPLLREKVEKIWGKEKTDRYYDEWDSVSWAQYEKGKYMGLFKYSDAMIHDCGSFIMEYLYMGKPVMYLMKDNEFYKNFNSSHKKALSLHYKGWNINDIEHFIQNVIDGVDPLENNRTVFKRDYLTPPNQSSASQNIIDCILSKTVSEQYLVVPKK